MTLSNETREFVRRCANDACEYCGLPQQASVLPHQIDHIIGRQHRGTDDVENLCLCCIRCNLKKGPNLASIDPDHRIDRGGRTTVELMDMNNEERVRLRGVFLRRGWRP